MRNGRGLVAVELDKLATALDETGEVLVRLIDDDALARVRSLTVTPPRAALPQPRSPRSARRATPLRTSTKERTQEGRRQRQRARWRRAGEHA